MTDVVLTPITSGYNLSKINANFDKVEDVINTEVVHTVGGNNTMLQDLDMNGHALLNLEMNPDDPGSMVTLAAGDARWYNVTGDTLTGPMQVNSQTLTGLKAAAAPTEAMRKLEFDGEVTARVNGDISLQDQLNGTNPPMGSAFSIISWHDQIITNSIAIPDNKNAWSFGPTASIDEGQTVVIGEDSFWTIAAGQTTGTGTLTVEVPSPLDMGVLP